MSGYFEADWLALREPADRAARGPELLHTVQRWSEGRSTLQITDLGSGTGSNPRYLAPALSADQHWRLLDHDADLLARADLTLSTLGNAGGNAVRITTRTADLTSPEDALPTVTDLVTASALLDLVSEHWLRQLATACRRRNAAVLFALSYDGEMAWEPALSGDQPVRQAVNAHQRGDKGFGPALGPDAAQVAARVFRAEGYTVVLESSPWRIGPNQAGLQSALLDGWLTAALEQQPDNAAMFNTWAKQRHAQIAGGEAHVSVGHQDLFARIGTK